MIEKRITHQLLEAGELSLTERECTALSLPEHSTTLNLELEGEPFLAQWNGRSRQLSGDHLTERMQDYGQDGGLLRLRMVDDTYRLTLLAPHDAAHITTVAPPVTPVTQSASPKAARRATVDRQFHGDNEYDWGTGQTPTVGFLREARNLLGDQLKAAGFDALELLELRLQGEELATLDDFEELLAVDVANVDRMPHQESVARHALSRMRGRAVLADEVGLGKTIEAGLAIKELTLRGLAKRVLILCPAPLRDQWREEMNHKFDLTFDVAYHGHQVRDQDKLILSLTLGRNVIDKLTKQPWDIVVVDEAHRAAGSGAVKTRQLITDLTAACRYAFFLTATPVQNNLLELYRLVELLRPGTFTSVNAFKTQYMSRQDPRIPNDPAGLRRLISSAMIRTTRAQAGVDRVKRVAVDVPVHLGARERELYALSTDLLRNIMRDSGDTMRRRSLALRLTASPFSMGTTALRMADRHPDKRVRKVLGEIGHLAMDIQGAAREDKALEITRDWIAKHGRVLIFTQHTDTVTGLLRRMDAEGLTARSFHGSMSATERAATIAAFKSGDSPIMISTDAGAEGQNLQFCNCVLNYDLPWNPMRIEQRIGRVDRLTQPKDEVHVANLYARNTIDQSVYRLLAEKLRMFELLFGQVTTILGELDESKSASFESRVLEALFADNDSKMEGLLSQLGSELVHARERASTLIAADSGFSNWMASAFEHRKGLTKAGITDLAPKVSEATRRRQRRVQKWVRSVLKALGAHILHDTGKGDGAFLTVQFDEEFEQELGGRTLLHLAFDRLGLEHHPDAELCAVGSPVFDELLALLRMRGDLHATVPVIPDDLGPSPFAHAPTTTLVRRRLMPSGSWSGHATFRATVGEAETTEHILTADIDGHRERRLHRRPLLDGETLPAAFDTPSKVITAFERAAAGQLEKLRRDRVEKVEQEQARELDRIKGSYDVQIAEAWHEEKDRLRRALRSEEARLNRRPDVRARAKVLALTLDEADWVIEETWVGPGGVETTLTYEWGLAEAPPVESDASGGPIRVLALCSGTHWVDATETTHCDVCDSDLCSACGDDAVFADCPVCGLSSCGACRNATGGVCRLCAAPERAPELDTRTAIGWRLNGGATLQVGDRVAELTRSGQSPSLLVPDEDVVDPGRIRMRSYASQHGLPMDMGLVLRDLSGQPPTSGANHLRLSASSMVAIEYSTVEAVGSTIDGRAIADLPDHPDTAVNGEGDFSIGSLLQRLRSDVPPPTPPAAVVTRRPTFTALYLESNRLVQQVSAIDDNGVVTVIDETPAALCWHEPSADDAVLADAELAGVRVSLERRNDAVLVSARGGDGAHTEAEWIALPAGTSAADQFAWFDRLSSLGMPGGRVGQRTNELLDMRGPFPSPTECELVERDIRPITELAPGGSGFDLAPADRATLKALGIETASQRQLPAALPSGLNDSLILDTTRSFTAVADKGFEVTETWRGHGTATHRYSAFDGTPAIPRLDDLGMPASDFGVCRDGHFYNAGTAALCSSCHTFACRSCDEVAGQASVACPTCSASVCRLCASGPHAVPGLGCEICSDKACSDCGRDPEVAACAICDRDMCARCRVDDLCPACRKLKPATDEQQAALPPELTVKGTTVLIGSDSDATVIIINRGDTIEQALMRDGCIDGWVAFGNNVIGDMYHLRLSASGFLGAPVIPVVEPLETERPPTSPGIVVQTTREFHAAWSVAEKGLSARSAVSRPRPEGNLAELIAELFPAMTTLPRALAATPPHVERLMASAPQPHTINLAMRWQRGGGETVLTASGLIDRRFIGSGSHNTQIDWTAGTHNTPTWVSDVWSPAPTVRAVAVAEGAEAAVIGLAALLAVGVRVGQQSEWYVVTASTHAAEATALARSMGAGDVDEVAAFTDPAAIKRSSVTNAVDTAFTVQPVPMVRLSSRAAHEEFSAVALRSWLPSVDVFTPELRVLPDGLRRELLQRMQPGVARMALDIGAQVVETITVDGGHEWRHEVSLLPGQTDARRFDSSTRVPRDAGVLDREGHFGPPGVACRYCGGLVCAHCAEGMTHCDCCAIVICRRCVREPHADLWLCPACWGIQAPSRSEARAHGRWLSAKGMLVGADDHHNVVVEQSKQRWFRQDEQGEKHTIAGPAVCKWLETRLAE